MEALVAQLLTRYEPALSGRIEAAAKRAAAGEPFSPVEAPDVAPTPRHALEVSDDAAAGALSTQFDGPRPAQAPGRAPYYPMRLTGSIILGIGGDNSGGGAGVFLEGVVLRGASTEAADSTVQLDINAFYSQASFI